MKIIKLEEIDSTHRYIKDYILENSYTEPLCIFTDYQTQGIGSRGNSWIGKKGNLFFSFVIDKDFLPNDLALQSSSIYFSFLLKRVLKDLNSSVWLKWPNDFYIENKDIINLSNNIEIQLIEIFNHLQTSPDKVFNSPKSEI